ncbi:MAG: GNAT family N-acetyltransferase [Bacteroidota bacterium]
MKLDKSSIIINLVGKHDIEAMVEYRIDYLSELYGSNETQDKEQLNRELTEYFTKSIAAGSFLAVVAKIEDRIIAFGGMILKQVPGDFIQSSYKEGEILNMYTIPQARNQGVGSLVLSELLQIAKKEGISKVALHTSQDGEKLYRSFGFTDPVYPYLEHTIETNYDFE